MFDHDKNGMVSKEEFFNAVTKYLTKAPITTDDIEGDIIGQKDKLDIVKMVNEDRIKPPVYEDFGFDADDINDMKRRK